MRTLALSCVVLTVLAPLALAQGIRWEPMNEPGCGGAITSLAVSPFDSRHLLVGGDMLGVGLSLDRGNTWQSTFGFRSWEIADFTWHPKGPSIVWVGTMSGPYVSHDSGRNWEERRAGFPPVSGGMYTVPIERVLFDPRAETHLLAFSGSSRRWSSPGKPAYGTVWESRDAGANWTRLCTITRDGSASAEAEGVNVVAVAYDSRLQDTLYALSDAGGVHVSRDNGRTWAIRNTGLPKIVEIGRLAVHPASPGAAYIGVKWARGDDGRARPGGIFKTTDAGLTWVEKSNGLAKQVTDAGNQAVISNYGAIAVADSDPRVLYTCDGSWAQGVIYRSTDGAESWKPVCTRGNVGQGDDQAMKSAFVIHTGLFAGLSMGYIAMDPRDANAVYAANSEYIARSLDGGKTWGDATCFNPDPKEPDQWRGRGYEGWCCTSFRFNPKDARDSILTGMDAAKLWRSRDGFKSWTYHGQEPWPWGGGSDACFAGPYIYATAGQFGDNLGLLRVSDRDGKTTLLAGPERGLPKLHEGGQPTGIYARPDAPERAWAVIGGNLFASTDAGERWTLVPAVRGLTWIAGDPTNPARFYVDGKDGIWRTEDGQHFGYLGGPRPLGGGRLFVDARGRLYACQFREGRGGLWRYADGKWTRLLDERNACDVATDPTNPSRIALGTSDHPYHDHSAATGVWVSCDDGKTWRQANTGLACLRVQCVAFNPHNPEQLALGTEGRGFFVGTWPRAHAPQGARSYTGTPEDETAAAVPPPPLAPARVKILVRNGAMTQGEGVPTNWTGKWGEGEVTRDAEVYKGAPASLRVAVSGGKSCQAFQQFDCKGNEIIRIAGWVRSSGKVKVNVAVQAFDAGWTRNNFGQVKYVQGDSDWTSFEKECALPDWAARFNIVLLVEGEGKAWLDEVHDADGPVDAGG